MRRLLGSAAKGRNVTPRIIIDTREQRPLLPWRSPRKGDEPGRLVNQHGQPQFMVPTVRGTLSAGDYSVEGLEAVVAIERKSVGDLYGTLYGSAEDASGDRRSHLERFRAELERMKGFARRWWLIEGNPGDLDVYMFGRGSRVKPESAHALIAALATDYDIPTIWLGPSGPEGVHRCAHFVGTVLGRVAEQASDEKAAKKARERGCALPWLMKEGSQ
jgi:ERCC4-type nuclease